VISTGSLSSSAHTFLPDLRGEGRLPVVSVLVMPVRFTVRRRFLLLVTVDFTVPVSWVSPPRPATAAGVPRTGCGESAKTDTTSRPRPFPSPLEEFHRSSLAAAASGASRRRTPARIGSQRYPSSLRRGESSLPGVPGDNPAAPTAGPLRVGEGFRIRLFPLAFLADGDYPLPHASELA
jgi:hypothetical protein